MPSITAYPGTVVDSSATGTQTWSDPGNASAHDEVCALVYGPLSGTAETHYLKGTNFNFSAIPAGSTIEGITVEMEGSHFSGGGYAVDSQIKLVLADGTIGSTNKAIADQWILSTDPIDYRVYGNSTDLWGWTPTLADIQDVDFGAVVSLNITYQTSGLTFQMDFIRITVHFSEASGKWKGPVSPPRITRRYRQYQNQRREQETMFKYIGKVNGSFIHTAGTVPCGKAEQVNFQVFLDGNSSYEVAAMQVQAAAATASKGNCSAVLKDSEVFEAIRPAGPENWWLAWRVYNGASAITGTANDKYAAEKLG